jgi:hypothetical protein
MKIEMLEKVLHGRDVFEAGEVRVVEDWLGEHFCKCGWAKDLDGNVETVPRDPNRQVTLAVDGAQHATVAGDANG